MPDTKDRSLGDGGFPPSCAQFFVRSDGPRPLIEISGELDLSNADTLAGCLDAFEPGDSVIVELSNLHYIDSRGLATLAQACGRGIEITCRGARGSVRTVLEICGMSTVVTIED